MAVEGSLFSEFVTENAFVLIIAVLVTCLVLALSTYYIGHIFMSSEILNIPSESQTDRHETSTREYENQNQNDKLNAERSASKAVATSAGDTVEQSVKADQEEVSEKLDPVYYCEHIQGEIKKVKQDVTTRKICESLTEQQISEERKKQQDQLAEIFKLMQEQQDKFGINSMDEIQDQMKLYANI